MAWTPNILFPFGSILTSAKMDQLRDNIEAIAENASGAPEIVSAALADYGTTGWGAEDIRNASLGHSEFKISTGSASGSLNAQQTVTISLTAYYFGLTICSDQDWIQVRTADATASRASPKISLFNSDALFASTYDLRWYYFIS